VRTSEPSVALPVKVRAACLPTDAVGHAVRISGDRVAGKLQVARVDIDAAQASEARAFGIIASKPDALTCVVQTSGILADVLTGLTPGQLLFVSQDATLSGAPPSRPISGQRTIQALAYAVASDAAIVGERLRVRLTAE